MSAGMELIGSFSDVNRINETLRRASEHFHLITPAPLCAPLPLGCLVGFNAIAIDPKTETHDVGGKRSLLRTALLKLANAAGVSWDAQASRQVQEDGEPAHPYFVHWLAVGAWRDLSTSWLPIVADYRLDLRDGTAATQKVLESAHDRVDDYTGKIITPAVEIGRVQLRDMRAKILERAQSGAKLRGIREALGIRSYTEDELKKKPFLVTRLLYVGTGDLEDRRAIRASFLGGAIAMFGAGAATRAHTPPVTDDGEVLGATLRCDYCGTTEGVREQLCADGTATINVCHDHKCLDLGNADAARPVASSSAPTPKPQAEKTSATQARPAKTTAATSDAPEHVVRFGQDKDKPLSALSWKGLRWYGDQIQRSIRSPDKAKWKRDNEAILAAVTEEMARRQGGAPSSASAPEEGCGVGEDDIPF